MAIRITYVRDLVRLSLRQRTRAAIPAQARSTPRAWSATLVGHPWSDTLAWLHLILDESASHALDVLMAGLVPVHASAVFVGKGTGQVEARFSAGRRSRSAWPTPARPPRSPWKQTATRSPSSPAYHHRAPPNQPRHPGGTKRRTTALRYRRASPEGAAASRPGSRRRWPGRA
jgi:hypothetical protein